MIRISAALVLIVGAGLVHGSLTDRWRPSPALVALGARIEAVPMVIGDWQGRAFELPAGERAMAGAVAYLSREYSNASRGISVQVLLLGGQPGKISTHTPDVCYQGGGYTVDSPSLFQRQYGPDDEPAEFRAMLATRGGDESVCLADSLVLERREGLVGTPRAALEICGGASLCKLYVVRQTAGAVVEPGADPCNDFLSVFLPELDKLGFSAGK